MVSGLSGAAGGAISGGIGIAGALGAFGQPGISDPTVDIGGMNQSLGPTAHAVTSVNATQDALANAYQQSLVAANLFGAPATTAQPSRNGLPAVAAAPAVLGEIPMLQTAMPELQTLQNQLEDQNASATQNTVAKLAPQLRATLAAYNPGAAELLDTLNSQAQAQLNTNGGLTPGQLRQLQQTVRGAQTARGMGNGTGDAAMEANYLFNNQQALRQQNQAFAGNVVGADQSFYGNPESLIFGGPGTLATPGPVLNSGPTLLSATTQQNADNALWGAQYNAQNTSNTTGFNTRMAGLSAIAGNSNAFGSMASNVSNLFGSGGSSAGAGAGLGGSEEDELASLLAA